LKHGDDEEGLLPEDVGELASREAVLGKEELHLPPGTSRQQKHEMKIR